MMRNRESIWGQGALRDVVEWHVRIILAAAAVGFAAGLIAFSVIR